MNPPGQVFAERLLNAAAIAESWSAEPRPGQVLDLLDQLDQIATRLSRFISPNEQPQSLHQSVRALHSMTTATTIDLDTAAAVSRVATRCAALAHREFRGLEVIDRRRGPRKEPKGSNDDQ